MLSCRPCIDWSMKSTSLCCSFQCQRMDLWGSASVPEGGLLPACLCSSCFCYSQSLLSNLLSDRHLFCQVFNTTSSIYGKSNSSMREARGHGVVFNAERKFGDSCSMSGPKTNTTPMDATRDQISLIPSTLTPGKSVHVPPANSCPEPCSQTATGQHSESLCCAARALSFPFLIKSDVKARMRSSKSSSRDCEE